MASNQFLSVPSAVRLGRGDETGSSETKTSTRQSRHPGYSLFEWKKLCETSNSMPSNSRTPQKIYINDLSQHNVEDDCWTAIRGKVYNVTKFLKYHPGRKAQLLRGAGIDCTQLYDKVHSWVNEETILKHCFIGYLVPGKGPLFHKLVVNSIQTVTHNTKLFTLTKPVGMDLHAGQFVRVRATIEGESVEREYTPIVHICDTNTDASHNLMLMIKIYPHGKMTRHLSKIKVGDSLSISGPYGSFCTSIVYSTKFLILIAAGSGLTPMISLINVRYSQKCEQQSTLLMFVNTSEEDILWKAQLEEVCHLFPKFQLIHVLSSPNSHWKGETGKMSYTILSKYLPQPSQSGDVKICISGPPGFTRTTCDILTQMNFSDDDIHSFD